MPRRKETKPDLDKLRETVLIVENTIQDNIQNSKDCLKVLREIKKLLEPEKPSLWKRLKTLVHK